MSQSVYVHVPHVEFRVDGTVPGHIEHEDGEAAPLCLAVPLIAGLSGALWAVLWFAVRGAASLWTPFS